ncbi:S-adenosylmethionine:tRNA ribosyltransferase-isomerase [Aquabacterium sp. A7-Y]|uniref:S-adenosylmethionine:tRNA ribosyltransferase-isomerase n=1 Tax=Aquabacterium sp. A7-Y TaxID=1349605 RepID=UPI00223E5702|nr:S-adenosylmethionine:tRNA ribosyltransferase-isomerase [Aquabacterium sp. A7-Y]MCW7540920.1 S-adenosylmethionine:tRNA ribosyltransferase-isomerase [Aquabacterium sp. A7-Y]
MIAAHLPIQRPADARLLVIGSRGAVWELPRRRLSELLRRGDLLVANDAATLPASLQGRHVASGRAIEVRLAGRDSLAPDEVRRFTAVVFGAGDHRLRTEDRPPPPALRPGDRLQLGPLSARVARLLAHPRLIDLQFDGTPAQVWAGLARHGRPVQYAHVPAPLRLWDVWTAFAAPPVAFEAPSAGFALDWATIAGLRRRGVGFATLTHAAGLSSTGDPVLDARLPLDEAYHIPTETVLAIEATRRRLGRVVAIGTTVVRALEHAAGEDGRVRPGAGTATQRVGPHSLLRVVDALLSGTHEPGTSHYQLLQAFTDPATLQRADELLERRGFRTHEFGDSLLVWRRAGSRSTARVLSREDLVAPVVDAVHPHLTQV